MMWQALFWLYLANAVLLITHEIDSAYWKEWELFGLPGGLSGFLALHLPLLAGILYGLVLVHERSLAGLVISLVLSAGGLFAFLIHSFFLHRGRPEFRAPASIAILASILLASVLEGAAAVVLLVA